MKSFPSSLALLLAIHTATHAGLEQRRLSAAFSAPPLMTVSSFTLSPDSATAAYRANATEVLRPDFFLVPLTGGTVVAANAHATPSTGGALQSTARATWGSVCWMKSSPPQT